MTIVPAADGYLGVDVLTQTQWELLCAHTGLVDLLEDPRYATPAERAPHALELTQVFADRAADKSRVVAPRCPGLAHPVRLRPAHRRGHDDGPARRPLVLHAGARSGRRRAPRAHAAVPRRRRTEPDPPGSVPGRRVPPAGPGVADSDAPPGRRLAARGGPFAGIRIVDLSMFWSGPLAADLFAQYGADVVKVESVQRVDGWRGLSGNPGVEGSNLFDGVNPNKSGITLDLTSERGRELLRPLVEQADALVENVSPRVMVNVGLPDDVLHAWNPDLVILSMPAFGLTGPWGELLGFAPTIEQLSGLPELTGYPDGPPALGGNSLADPCAGLAVASPSSPPCMPDATARTSTCRSSRP